METISEGKQNANNTEIKNNSHLFESFLLFQKFLDTVAKVNSVPNKDNSTLNNTYAYNNNNNNINVSKSNTSLNYDDRPIRHTSINFVELVEKNLNELKETEKNLSSCASCPKSSNKNYSSSDFSFHLKEKNSGVFDNYRRSGKIIDKSRNKVNTSSNIKTLNLNSNTVINQNIINSANKTISMSKSLFKDENEISESFESEKSIIYNFSSFDDTITNEPKIIQSQMRFCNKFAWQNEINKIKQRANEVNSQISLYNSSTSPMSMRRNENSKLSKQLLKEFEILKEEQTKLEKMKKNIFADFNREKKKYEKLKNEENKKIQKIKDENALLNTLRKKDQELIQQLKNEISHLKTELTNKDANYKNIIETLQLELSQTNKTLCELIKNMNFDKSQKNPPPKNVNNSQKSLFKSNKKTKIISSLPHFKKTRLNELIINKSSINLPIKKEKKENIKNKSIIVTRNNSLTNKTDSTIVDELLLNINEKNKNNVKKKFDLNKENFDLIFDNKYKIEKNAKIFSKEKTKDGKTVIEYENNSKELIFPSGVKEQIFDDGFKIIYYTNKNIKQIFPNGKIIYFFNDSKITQTFIPELNVHIYKYKNGMMEKHYPNGKKEIFHIKQ